MKSYLDASVLVQLLNGDLSLSAKDGPLLVSSFAAGEVGSVLSRLVRMRELSMEEANAWLAEFDAWCDQTTTLVETDAIDIRIAARTVRTFGLQTKLPDTIHMISAERHGAMLVTSDHRLAAAADRRGGAVKLA
jgi:predicted nucleic acid-binding protein